MRRWLWVSVVLLAVPAHADVLYTYTGNTFGSLPPGTWPTVSCPYALDDCVSGWLLFADTLIAPGFSNTVEATPVNYSFSDGVQTLDATNSTIAFQYGGREVFHGADGVWSIVLESTASPGNRIFSWFAFGSADDQGWFFGDYGRVTNTLLHSDGNPGTWTVEPVAVETTEPSALLLIATAALCRLRRRHDGGPPG